MLCLDGEIENEINCQVENSETSEISEISEIFLRDLKNW